MEITLSSVDQIPAPQRIEEVIDSYIASRDVALSSRRLYRRTLKQYFTWIDGKGYSLSEVAKPELLQYKEELINSGKSSLTVSSYITSLRNFYEWTEANKIYPNVAKGLKNPKKVRQYRKEPLLPAQATALLSYYQDKALRDYAIVNLLLRTGLRTIEVIRANVGDVVYRGTHRVLLIHGKGRIEKDEYVILTDKAYKPIADYLATRPTPYPQEPLFTSTSNNSKGQRLTTRSISYIAKEGLKGIGLPDRRFTAHSLRTTAIVNCRRAGGTVEQAQALARHKSITTTQIYDEVFREEDRLKNSGEALLDNLF